MKQRKKKHLKERKEELFTVAMPKKIKNKRFDMFQNKIVIIYVRITGRRTARIS